MTEILRRPVAVQSSIVTDTTAGASTAISNETASILMVRVTSGSTSSVNVFGAESKAGTYLQMTFAGSDLTAIVGSSDWTVLPAAVLAAPWIKLVGDVAGVLEVIGKG